MLLLLVLVVLLVLTHRRQILSDDYRKAVLLRDDRTLEFHAHYGLYYKTVRIRLPPPLLPPPACR